MEKYELTSETKVINGVELHRIKALKSFRDIKDGDLGGWIECEKNLSQCGDAWVFDNASVFGHAWVGGNARSAGTPWSAGTQIILCSKIGGLRGGTSRGREVITNGKLVAFTAAAKNSLPKLIKTAR